MPKIKRALIVYDRDLNTAIGDIKRAIRADYTEWRFDFLMRPCNPPQKVVNSYNVVIRQSQTDLRNQIDQELKAGDPEPAHSRPGRTVPAKRGAGRPGQPSDHTVS